MLRLLLYYNEMKRQASMISHHRQLLAKLNSCNLLLVTLFEQIPGDELMLRCEWPREKPEKATTEAVSVRLSLKELELCRFTAARLSSFH